MATAPDTMAPETATEPEGLYEVVEGQVVEKPLMGAYGVQIASMLQTFMDTFARSNGLGQAVAEMLFRIDPDRRLARRPDVAFIAVDRWPLGRRAPNTAAWEVVPDLAVEVISPQNKTLDDLKKLEEYFRAGTRMVWIVLPSVDKVYVYESPTAVTILALGDTLDGGAVLPGFRLPLRTLFGDEAD
jgi:Uma2 family endonuclease